MYLNKKCNDFLPRNVAVLLLQREKEQARILPAPASRLPC